MTSAKHTITSNSGLGQSKPTVFKVRSQLGAPTVLEAEANGATLFPFKAINGATVKVAYAGMTTSDKIAVSYRGHNEAATFLSEPQNGSASGSVTFSVPASVIGASQGTSVNVQYSVTRGSDEPQPSVPLDLKVTVLSDDRLTTPEVPQAQGEVLDLDTFEGDATIKVLNSTAGYVWPLWGAEQTYWVVLEGTLANEGEYKYYLANPGTLEEAHGTAGLTQALPRAELESLKNDSELKVILKVGYDKDRDESKARMFPVKAVILKNEVELPEPVIPLLNNNRLEPVEVLADGLEIQVRPHQNIEINDSVTVQFGDYLTHSQIVDSTRTLFFRVPQVIVDNHMGTSTSASYLVNKPNASGRQSKPLNFDVLELLIEDFNSFPGPMFPIKIPLICRILTITQSAFVQLGQQDWGEFYDGYGLYAGSMGNPTILELKRPVREITFAVSGSLQIELLDKLDNVLKISRDTYRPTWYHHSEAQPTIKKIRLNGFRSSESDSYWIDNIKIAY